MDRCGERALPLLREAIDLAHARGLERVFADAHPGLGDWVRQVQAEASGAPRPSAALAAPMRAQRVPEPRLRSTPSLALTPKEREVLGLLANNLSNKEIGLAMQVGEETIKWHMKNLLAKLDAGNRKQVVSRARLLGLLEAAD
jgi:LuxR family maltose regulon positive regulatory protein